MIRSFVTIGNAGGVRGRVRYKAHECIKTQNPTDVAGLVLVTDSRKLSAYGGVTLYHKKGNNHECY